MKLTRKQRKKLRRLLALACIPILALVFFSGWKIYSILHGYKAAERRYDNLAGAVAAASELSPDALPSVQAPAAEAPEEETPQVTDAPAERSPVTVDFDALRSYGGKVVGWLYLPGTVINYPVAQAMDNEYYLDRFLDGNFISGGTLFADCACPSDFSGKNTIIYGHNMKDGSMFAHIADYAVDGFYEEHPVMYLNTPAQNYRVDLFSGFTTHSLSFVYQTAFATDEDYAAFLRALYASSEIDCGVTVTPEDRIVTLSTCAYSSEDARFVVCGKLTPIA